MGNHRLGCVNKGVRYDRILIMMNANKMKKAILKKQLSYPGTW